MSKRKMEFVIIFSDKHPKPYSEQRVFADEAYFTQAGGVVFSHEKEITVVTKLGDQPDVTVTPVFVLAPGSFTAVYQVDASGKKMSDFSGVNEVIQ